MLKISYFGLYLFLQTKVSVHLHLIICFGFFNILNCDLVKKIACEMV